MLLAPPDEALCERYKKLKRWYPNNEWANEDLPEHGTREIFFVVYHYI